MVETSALLLKRAATVVSVAEVELILQRPPVISGGLVSFKENPFDEPTTTAAALDPGRCKNSRTVPAAVDCFPQRQFSPGRPVDAGHEFFTTAVKSPAVSLSSCLRILSGTISTIHGSAYPGINCLSQRDHHDQTKARDSLPAGSGR